MNPKLSAGPWTELLVRIQGPVVKNHCFFHVQIGEINYPNPLHASFFILTGFALSQELWA